MLHRNYSETGITTNRDINVSSSSIIDGLGYTPVNQAGDTMTGKLAIGSGDNSSAYVNSTPLLSDIRVGTAASPDLTAGPTVKIVRSMSLTQAALIAAGGGGDANDHAPALSAVAVGVSGNEVQPIGVHGVARNSGTSGVGNHDACGIYGVGRITGAGTGSAIGAFFIARRDNDVSNMCALEIHCANYGTVDAVYNSTGFSRGQALWINCSGNADSGSAITVSNAFGRQFENGLSFTAQVTGGKTGGARVASIRDDGNAGTSLLINGTHATAAIGIAAASGRVGIGTTSPSYQLDIVAPTADGICARFSNAGAPTTKVYIDNSASDGDPLLVFRLPGIQAWQMGIDDSDTDKFKIGKTESGTWADAVLTLDTSSNATLAGHLTLDAGIIAGSGTRTISSAPAASTYQFRREVFNLSGAASAGQPATGYLYTPEVIPHYIEWYATAGHNESTSTNTGRTGLPAIRIVGSSSGQGDFVAYNASMSVSGTRSGSTHFLANPAAVILNGQATALADGVYLNVQELNMVDGGFDAAAIGTVYNLNRTVGTGAKYATWLAVRANSVGAQDADAAFSVSGKWKVGLDFTPATLSANKAAITLKANDRIYFNATATADPAGAKWYADTMGLPYMTYDSGSSSIVIGNAQLYLPDLNIRLGTTTGTKIGTATTQKIGFFNATPIVQPTVGVAATDAASTQTLANNLRTALINLGLVAA